MLLLKSWVQIQNKTKGVKKEDKKRNSVELFIFKKKIFNFFVNLEEWEIKNRYYDKNIKDNTGSLYILLI